MEQRPLIKIMSLRIKARDPAWGTEEQLVDRKAPSTSLHVSHSLKKDDQEALWRHVDNPSAHPLADEEVTE
jgi:hypothetical protein